MLKISAQPADKLAVVEHCKEMFEQKRGNKPKAAIYYIKEGNRQREDKKCKMSPSPEYGFANPFLPGGCLSDDADLMVKMWKEKRLAEWYCQTVTGRGI
eukprot:GFUD01054490.1.p2 GENE.GFUD01054490.1~~GFUD01054490.1.p2  ORF type:complete len:108 (+),score=36.26 GFUD01054490.1:29-325(+)